MGSPRQFSLAGPSRAPTPPGWKGGSGWLTRLALGGLLCGWVAGAVWAEQRFPPPDFQSGYQMPHLHPPNPRALWLQYLDLAVLFGALGVASWLTLKRRSRRGILGLSIFSVLYFGFYRTGCLCSIGSVQNVALALFDSNYVLPLGTLGFFAAPLVTALFFGRSFCAGVCPHGALQDLVLVKPLAVPRWLEQGLGLLPFFYLGLGVLFAATGSGFIICRYDPLVPIFRLSGGLTMVLAGAAFLVLGLVIGRPYCRFLCPYGALLRLASSVSKWAVRITPDYCTQCRLCEAACPFGVIREPFTQSPSLTLLRGERRRFLLLVVLLPLLVAGGGWLGSQFAAGFARVHKDVALADLYLQQQAGTLGTNLATADQLALGRADRTAERLLPSAVQRLSALRLGGWVLGGWVGLVAALRLLGFSFWQRHNDYEPERGGCYGCARCFEYCPQERVRLGLMPAEAAPKGPPAPTPAA